MGKNLCPLRNLRRKERAKQCIHYRTRRQLSQQYHMLRVKTYCLYHTTFSGGRERTVFQMWVIWADRLQKSGMTAAALILTLVCAVYDVRKKRIPILPIVFGILFAAIVRIRHIWAGEAAFLEIILSILPGIFILTVGFCSKEKVGYGDGILLVMIGLMTGFLFCLGVLCISLAGSCIYALFLLVFQKAEREAAFPFVPFLALAMGICMVL